MNSLLYENQPRNMKEMLKLAEELGFNIDKFVSDMESEATKKEVADEINRAAEIDIDATPTMYVNGEQVVGVKPYYQLKEILVKHGAKK